jgi:hypothetical protein
MALAIRSNSKISYSILSVGAFTATLAVRETSPAHAPKPRLLDQVREAVRARHYSRRTEKAYIHWIKRYIFFHGKRHPAELGASEVTAFLTSLAVHDKVAASTQNHALSALLFLYREVLSVELPWLDDVIRPKRPQHLPVALTRDEVRAVLQRLNGAPRLMALLLYGAGLRLLECCLRVKDVDFATNQIVIRHGKGGKDRVTMLPAAVKAALIAHLERARKQHQADLRHGAGRVELPSALTRKYPNAGRRVCVATTGGPCRGACPCGQRARCSRGASYGWSAMGRYGARCPNSRGRRRCTPGRLSDARTNPGRTTSPAHIVRPCPPFKHCPVKRKSRRLSTRRCTTTSHGLAQTSDKQRAV